MTIIEVKIKKLENFLGNLPEYATEHSAGMDLVAANEQSITIKVGSIQLIPTGIAIALPESFEAQIRPRSGLAVKHGITVANSPGTIDADYRGEIKVLLINLGNKDFIIEKGMRIAQMIIAKYERVLWAETSILTETMRGRGGFGSTGL
ncbi:dUTP diphosphatase [Rickettsia prowazekii]|uniref:Deoxyuridine 5'-triphosphate nucleotidohydrolase n=3 Tax=Rickettsia prowazekii TaxID=782 RepID=DUT_RICPR|nr:dUTP diphosphatase [Rickettsia prowazekii]Q9ZDD2.1 RecName: Full=Deoxyuridine 5'-triphosphate nucleotidohydrolase; Short=dUTPase; AltName: Full=dUTP pyrophosphatase [Rickettsia prowazekii str. Madrid E]EOB09765.1 protease SOHB [Rickettsia prowazekii str. GvF12]ADE29925.1 Deoxyuridine 5'-triphosphate nucleotidohydrolase [Rickettsia prowazekii str. Rp22]AFE49212.1 deoxyuridine 5'-triphosphate nucleotidohydrolase [Rickettsia prowazekii str. Chernikova]AFE50058.1 deoxyuridine 5'-triphosphate nu